MARPRLHVATIFTAIGLLIGLAVAWRITGREPSSRPPGSTTNAAGDPSGTRQAAVVPIVERPRIASWRSVEDFDKEIAVFESVFWDSRDTESLRKLIRDESTLRGKTVLEIGTGSGLISLCCLQAGARHVVATDVNRAAVANAVYNAELLQFANRLDVRLVPLDNASAFHVITSGERFDLIVSNPPWVDQQPQTIEQFALYDANFALMRSLIEGLREHLNPGGRVLLAYGCVEAIKTLRMLAEKNRYELIVHDDRALDELPNEFLPGMLLEIRP